MGRMRQSTRLAVLAFISLVVAFAGCGGGSQAPLTTPVAPSTPAAQNASVTGQYNMVLSSSKGQGTTNVYTKFAQTGTTFAGTANTLVCPSNDLSQCKGNDASGVSITPSGTVSGTNVTMMISFPSTAGTNTVTMVGAETVNGLAGTYADSQGDSGTWTASTANYPFGPSPAVSTYSGTFNSVSNPLMIPPTISVELGQDASFNLTGKATIMNSPCISSLALSGHAIGDAFSLTDAGSKASIIALPNLPTDNNFHFSYKFEPTAASCAGDFGRGVVTINVSPWDY